MALAVLALIAAVLAPTAAAQTRSIGTVVIANGWSSADSAVASALAALESDSRSDAVVLYASRRELSTRVANYIKDHQPSEVILVGGTAALSSNVQADVADIVGSSAVRRIEGRDRFDTAAKAVPSTATTFIVANGYSAADTGVAAAVAATRTDAAVLLAETDSLTEPTERILREQQLLAVEFVGGTAVLASELADRVQELAPSVRNVPRHSGASRTATAAAAAPNRSTTLVIANGWSPADMGVAAAYAAITSNAAVLYSQTSSLTEPTETRIRALAPRAIVLVGGSAALDNSLHARLHTLAPAATLDRISGTDRIDTSVRAADGTLTRVATELPGTPTSLAATARNASLALSWRAPATTTDGAVTGYVVEYRACTATPKTCTSNPRWSAWVAHAHSGTGTSTNISSLINGTAYEVRVRASNSFGNSPSSQTATATPLAQTAKPSVPVGFTVEAANRLLKVSWDPSIPPRDGTVSGYEVEYRECIASDSTCASSPSWGNWMSHTHSGTGTTTTITKLDNGTAYQVRVQATSTRGVSGWSPARSATPALLPSFERAPTLEAGDRQILVQWNEPADSGSPIRDYDVQYRACTATDADATDLTCTPAADATWGNWRSRSHSGTGQSSTITGLVNGTAYQVQVRASNSNGAGPWSTAAKTTPISVPAKPSTPTVEPGNTKLVVTWTAPSDNGSSITTYDVEYCTGTCASDSSDWENNRAVVNAPATRHEFGSLANGTAYKVRVRAVNVVGDSPWSAIRSAAPKALPEAPSPPRLTAGHRQLDVSWSEPTTNGTTITGYDIHYRACTATPRDCFSNPRWGSWRGKGHTGNTAPLESTITSLTNATKYEVKVRARISGGVGPFSTATAGTPLGKPAKPATPRLTAGDGVLVMTWTAPADNGSAITDYKVERCESTANCTVDANWVEDTTLTLPTPDPVTEILTHTISGLTNGTTYRVRLLAANNQGDGPWSSTVSGTPTVRPDAPTNLRMSVTERQVSLLWNAANNKGVALTGYDVEYRACEETASDDTVLHCNSDPTWGDWKTHPHSGVGISTTITGLTNGTRYQARVRARNANGAGPWSAEPHATGIPLAAASTPTGLTVEAAHRQLSVSWTASAPRGSTITGYVMQHRECLATPKSCTTNARWSDWTDHSDTGTSTNRTISSLTNGTKYEVRVQTKSRTGTNDVVSGWSQIRSATPAAVPDAPSSLTLTPDDRQITVSWNQPADHDSAINDYDVEFRVCTATNGDTTDRTCDTNPTWGAWLTHNHSGASRSTVITSLTNGAKHQVRVRATNANGVGPWSVPTSADEATPVGAPAAPTTPRVTAGDAQLTVDWIVPRSNGSAITGYDVWHRPCTATPSEYGVESCGPIGPWGDWVKPTVSGIDTTMAIMSGLINGTAYQVQVRAVTSNRQGPWSSAVIAMPVGAPSAPTNVELASGNRALYLSWPAPDSNGSTVSGFKLRYCDTSESCHATTGTDWVTVNLGGATRRTHTIGSLTNAATYTVELLTTSSNKGESGWSSAVSATAGGPNQPGNVRLAAGSQQIGVTWTAPGQNHSAISSYDVEYRACTATNGDDTVLTCTSNPTWGAWSASGVSVTGTTATISSLTSDTRYQVRVRANNTQGAGRWSATPAATPTS
ncbi:MAG: fibronectin type III domain-containing protein [Acidimicrobiaceae bacterium]|nr:fibronectin type III domain-containing protein [Acidimicrobiaceae bacterium]